MRKRFLKLNLSKETLRSLAEEDARVAGGATFRTCGTCNFTCGQSQIVCCATGGEANSCPCA